MSTILMISGSLRQGSFNHQLAEKTATLLQDKVETVFLDWSQVPVFSQDLEQEPPMAVTAVREAVQKADAIWIFSPVYNNSIPGPVKNLLDWLSRSLDLSDLSGPSAIAGKLVTVSSAANSGQEGLMALYQDLLSFIRTKPVGDFTQTRINPEAWQTGQLVITQETQASLQQQVAQLLAEIPV